MKLLCQEFKAALKKELQIKAMTMHGMNKLAKH